MRLRRRGASPAHDDGEAGFSIIELALTGALMSLIGTLVMTTVIGGAKTSARAEKRTDDVGRAQIALLGLNADIRAAASIAALAPDRLEVTTRVPSSGVGPTGTPETVAYWVDATGVGCPGAAPCLKMTRSSTGTAVRVVLPHVLPPSQAGRPLFRALSITDSAKQCPTGPTSGSLGSTVAAADLADVFAVDVWVSVNSAPQLTSTPLVLSAGAVLANQAQDKEINLIAGSLGLGEGCS